MGLRALGCEFCAEEPNYACEGYFEDSRGLPLQVMCRNGQICNVTDFISLGFRMLGLSFGT